MGIESLGNTINRTEKAEDLTEFLQRIHAYDFIQGVLSGTEEKPAFGDFLDFITRVNGQLRGIPTGQRKDDGDGVQLTGFIGGALVPAHQDKVELLEQAYNALDVVTQEDVKYIIPLIINAVHLFSDGNGRTSRAFFHLLSEHGSNKEWKDSTKAALDTYGRYDTYDISPAVINDEVELEVLQRHGWKTDDNLPLSFRNIKPSDANDIGYASIEFDRVDANADDPKFSVFKKVTSKFSDDSFYIRTAISGVLGDKLKDMVTDRYRIPRISGYALFEQSSQEELEQILASYYSLKREHVEQMIDVFANPDDHHVIHDGKSMTIRDYFVQEVQRKYEENQI